MSKAYYVLVSSSYDELEVYLKGMTGRVGSAQSIESVYSSTALQSVTTAL